MALDQETLAELLRLEDEIRELAPRVTRHSGDPHPIAPELIEQWTRATSRVSEICSQMSESELRLRLRGIVARVKASSRAHEDNDI